MFELIIAILLTTAEVEWPQFRGPKANGHAMDATTPLVWFDEESETSQRKNIAWKLPLPGLGWSSPIVVDSTIYLTTAIKEADELSLMLLAIDSASGSLRWEKEIHRTRKFQSIHQKNSYASPTPIYSDGAIYVHFGPVATAKVSLSGDIVWLATDLEYPAVHGSGGSPILFEDKLIFVCDGSSKPYVIALDTKTGRPVWKRERSIHGAISHSFVTPTLCIVDGIPQLFAPGPDHFASYDARNGDLLWYVKAQGWSVVPQPVVGPNLVVYNHDYDHPELIAIRIDGQGDVTASHILWRLDRGAPSTPSPLLVSDRLYFVSDKGIASCVDVTTGHKHWTQRLGGNFSASPIFANNAILFLDEDGQATWVADSVEFKKVAQATIQGKTLATPAFTSDAMYLRSDTHLFKITQVE